MTEAAAHLNLISYRYPTGDTFALKDISLTVGKGEFVALLGSSGSGKTTLCRLFSGIVPQFYGGSMFGEGVVAGLDVITTPIAVMAGRVGSVFQDPEAQFVCATAEQEVAFVLENLGRPVEEIRHRIPEVLDAVGLAGFEKKQPHELSGGHLTLLSPLRLRPTRPCSSLMTPPHNSTQRGASKSSLC